MQWCCKSCFRCRTNFGFQPNIFREIGRFSPSQNGRVKGVLRVPLFHLSFRLDSDAQLHLKHIEVSFSQTYHDNHPSMVSSVFYGSLFFCAAIFLVVFAPQLWFSHFWKSSYDAAQPELTSPAATAPKAPVWLIVTISAAKSFERRNIIRATWQSLYKNPVFETRFVIADPGEALLPIIEFENKTHGDLIMISVCMMHSILQVARTETTLNDF